jgi:hypothetical protein
MKIKITNQKDTKESRINDLKLRFNHHLISEDLYHSALKYLKQNKTIIYYTDIDGVVHSIKHS